MGDAEPVGPRRDVQGLRDPREQGLDNGEIWAVHDIAGTHALTSQGIEHFFKGWQEFTGETGDKQA